MDTNESTDPWDEYRTDVIELAALMAEAGRALVFSLDGGADHDEQAAAELLGAIFELAAVEQRYELECLFRRDPAPPDPPKKDPRPREP